MKITVLNGSPKGALSVTLQYVNFIQKKNPQHELKVHHVSQKIRKIEKDDEAFQAIMQDIETSDGVLWAVPLYVMLVPCQYKRFIELIWEKHAEDTFKNKYAAVITTSIHFYDHTANNYMHAVCDDLNMKYVDFFSPDMNDLLKEEERARLLLFADNFFEAIEKKVPTARHYEPLHVRDFDYTPGEAVDGVDSGGRKVLLMTDSLDEGTNLGKMIQRFRDSFLGGIEVVDLNGINIKGGCLGCIQCGFDGRCIYTGKDEFIDFYDSRVKTADILVYAGTVTDRYLSWTWKRFFDRGFYNNHMPTQKGKQIAYIVSGPLSQIPNLRQILEAGAEIQHANLTGIVTDEYGESEEIDALLQNLAECLLRYTEKGYVRPDTFLGVGGAKIFRDAIWARLRFPFLADHEYYEEHGFYDFPQDDTKSIEFSTKMIQAIEDPETREAVRKMIKTQMVEPHKHIVATR